MPNPEQMEKSCQHCGAPSYAGCKCAETNEQSPENKEGEAYGNFIVETQLHSTAEDGEQIFNSTFEAKDGDPNEEKSQIMYSTSPDSPGATIKLMESKKPGHNVGQTMIDFLIDRHGQVTTGKTGDRISHSAGHMLWKMKESGKFNVEKTDIKSE